MNMGSPRNIAAAAVLLIASPLVAQDDSGLMDEISQCGDITDTEERLACYDRINRSDAAPADAPKPVAESPAVIAEDEVTNPAQESPAVEEFGLPKEEEDYGGIYVNVVRCQESNHRFYFYLDNDQVWKYIGTRNLRYKNCNSPATIKEDVLGFRLEMEGEPGLRVQRIR
jgi:hypothetical protein